MENTLNSTFDLSDSTLNLSKPPDSGFKFKYLLKYINPNLFNINHDDADDDDNDADYNSYSGSELSGGKGMGGIGKGMGKGMGKGSKGRGNKGNKGNKGNRGNKQQNKQQNKQKNNRDDDGGDDYNNYNNYNDYGNGRSNSPRSNSPRSSGSRGRSSGRGITGSISNILSKMALPITFPWHNGGVRLFIIGIVFAFILKYSMDIAQADKKKIQPTCPSLSIIKKFFIFLAVMYYVLGIIGIVGDYAPGTVGYICTAIPWIAALGSFITIIVIFFTT